MMVFSLKGKEKVGVWG